MKNIKICILLILLVVMTTSGCKTRNNNLGVNDMSNTESTYYNYETDCQFNVANPPFNHYVAKGNEGYFALYDGYIYFIDMSSDSGTLLCSKPNCLHNSIVFNTDCYAHIGEAGSITFNEGYIYYIGSNVEAEDGTLLMRIKADGSGVREKVCEKEYNTDKWVVHRGYFYNAYREYKFEDKLDNINKSRLIIEKVSLDDTSSAEILFDSSEYLQDSSFRYLAAFDNYLYYSYSFYEENDEHTEKLYCYDLENGTQKEVTIPQSDTNSQESDINYIYPLGNKMVFKAGADIYSCDLNAENTEKVMTLEDEYHNVFTDGTYFYEDNFANYMHSDILSIKKDESRILKVYDINLNLVDTLDIGDYEMSFRPIDDEYFLNFDYNGKISYFDKSEFGSVKGGSFEKHTIEIIG